MIKQTHHVMQALALRLAASLGSVGSQAAGTVIPISLRPPASTLRPLAANLLSGVKSVTQISGHLRVDPCFLEAHRVRAGLGCCDSDAAG